MNNISMKSRTGLPISLTIFLGIAALTISILLVSIWRRNDYNVYSLSQLKWAAILTAVLFGAAYGLAFFQFHRIATAISLNELLRQAAIGVVVGLVASWFWPAAVPAVPLPGNLQIQALGQQNEAASGANVEIRKISNLDGSPIGLKRFQLSGEWKIQNGHLVSEGRQPGALAEYNGPIAGGVILELRYNLDAGQARVTLNGSSSQVDLYSDKGVSYPQAFGEAIWQNAGWQQKLATSLAFAFQIIGVAGLILLLWLPFRLKWRIRSALLILVLGLIFLSYLRIKLDYAQFNGGRAFRDTSTYVQTAMQPITSSSFWI